MQDRFKFRYFNKLCNKMVEPKNWQNVDAIFECLKQQVCFDENISPLPYNHVGNGLVFMQCTGLKDKNGKLIYEGDIIKIEYYDYGIKYRIGVVEWEDDGFCVTYHNAKDTKVSGCSLVDIVNGDKQEVISNIYENPELLEEANNDN